MFDLARLTQLVEDHGTVARVVIAAVKGSAPREPGASIFVWADGQEGTIGGGQLEFQAINEARAKLGERATCVTRAALGPAMNQCCGGAVTLVTEIFDESALSGIDAAHAFARKVEGNGPIPGHVTRAINRTVALGTPAPILFSGGWLIEPMTRDTTPVVIYGAGHVGLALAAILEPLPNFDVTLADDREMAQSQYSRNTDAIQTVLLAADNHAIHLIMTHSHAADLDICHRLLSRPTGGIGLIGSATKWARFNKRLAGLGHTPDAIARITSPIGDPTLGKHPQAIALGVATDLLSMVKTPLQKREAS